MPIRESRPISTRPLTLADYETVLSLWQAAEGVEVAEGDGRDEIARYLERNPGLSRVAEIEGEIVGAVLCGHDGRRGHIYHLAVATGHRGHGLGRRLVLECVDGLRRCGIKRALLLVAGDNAAGRSFWISQGFAPIAEALPMGLDLP